MIYYFPYRLLFHFLNHLFLHFLFLLLFHFLYRLLLCFLKKILSLDLVSLVFHFLLFLQHQNILKEWAKFQGNLEQIKLSKYKKPISNQEFLKLLQQYHIRSLPLKEQLKVRVPSTMIFMFHRQKHQPKLGKKWKGK